MATLAEVLRQAGYVTPQGQITGPRTDLAQKLKGYVTNVIPNALQNAANQRADIDAALTMGQGGVQIGDREAFARQMAEVPNLMGSVDSARKQALMESFNKIAGGEKPVRSAVVMIGDKIFTGNTHTQAFQKAIHEGVVRKEGSKYIYPQNADIDWDLFMLNDGRIVDRLTASKMLNIGSSEGALEKNMMQIRPAKSMTVQDYKNQAKQLIKPEN